MITIPFWAGELALALIWLAVRVCIWLKNKKIDWKREALLLLMFINLAVLLRFTFFPFGTVDGHVQPLIFEADKVLPLRINWIPYVHLFYFESRRDLLVNLIGNTAMFIPSGFILPILYKRLNSFWKVLAAGAGISLCIELLQLPFHVRATDVDDLILNTAGVAIGYGIYALVRAIRRKKKP